MEPCVGYLELDTLTFPRLCEFGDTDKEFSMNASEVTSNSCKHGNQFLANSGDRRNIRCENM